MPLTLAQLCRRIGFPADLTERWLAYETGRTSVLDAELTRRLLCRETWDDAFKELADRLEDDPDHLLALWEEMRLACGSWDEYRRRGLPEDVFDDTMRFCTRYVIDELKASGRYRFTAGWWFPRQLALELFRLGSLEFEMAEEPEERRIYLHIPTDASLRPEDVDDSFRRWRAFMKAYYPDWQDAAWYCNSWLMSPVLSRLLPPGSRILAFQRRFEVLEVYEKNMGAVKWIWPGPDREAADLPADNTLRRAMKAFLLDGGIPGWALARLKEEG